MFEPAPIPEFNVGAIPMSEAFEKTGEELCPPGTTGCADMDGVNMTGDSGQASDDKPRYSARELTGSGQTAEIVLDGQIYTLRITRSGKLILTK